MARYNEILVGRLNRYLQKFLSMKADAPAPQLASDWQPTVDFNPGEADLRYLQGWETFGTGVTCVAATGFNSGLLIRNPKALNIVAVIEKITVSVGAAHTLEWSVGAVTTDLPTIATTVGFDGRGRQFGAGCIVSSNPVGSGVPGLGVVGLHNFAAGQQYELIIDQSQEFPLLPGFGCEVRLRDVTLQVIVSVKWRERFLEDSERT